MRERDIPEARRQLRPSIEPENFSGTLRRDIKALTAGLIAGTVAYTIAYASLQLVGLSTEIVTLGGFVALVPASVGAYFRVQRR